MSLAAGVARRNEKKHDAVLTPEIYCVATPPTLHRWRTLAVLTFARTAMGFQFQTIAAVSPFLDKDISLDNAQLGWLIGLYLLPGIAFALPVGLLAARFGDRWMTLAGLATMTIGGIVIALADSYGVANAGRIVSGYQPAPSSPCRPNFCDRRAALQGWVCSSASTTSAAQFFLR